MIEPLKTVKKSDDKTRLDIIKRLNIPPSKFISGEELNLLFDKINEIISALSESDLQGLAEALLGKADLRLANLPSDLTPTEKTVISDKLGVGSAEGYKSYGLGTEPQTNINIDTSVLLRDTRFVGISPSTGGTLPFGYGSLINISYGGGDEWAQIAINQGENALVFRTKKYTGTIGSWINVWNSSNFNPSTKADTSEINNIYDQLSAKANERLSNVSNNLSLVEKSEFRNKIGADDGTNKANIRLSNLANNLSDTEKINIKDKLGIEGGSAEVRKYYKQSSNNQNITLDTSSSVVRTSNFQNLNIIAKNALNEVIKVTNYGNLEVNVYFKNKQGGAFFPVIASVEDSGVAVKLKPKQQAIIERMGEDSFYCTITNLAEPNL